MKSVIPMTEQPVRTIITEIATQLEQLYESSSHAHTVAWWLLEALTKKSKANLIVALTIELSPQQEQQLTAWIIALTQEQYPLQYLLGSVPFGQLTLLVEAPTLIPRPETEEWVTNLIQTLTPIHHEPLRILDMCTGSGCIGLSFAKAFPRAKVIGVDCVDTALTLAKKNATHNNLTNIHFLKSDLFSLLNEEPPFDLIITNPPYISPELWPELSPTLTKWEDRQALVAGNQGLELIQIIAQQGPHFLTKQSPLTLHGYPRLVMEIGYDQGLKTEHLFIDAGFSNVKVLTDSAGRDRVVCGW